MTTPLSVPVSRELADVARKLRAWVNTPGYSDICAGTSPIDVGTLERFNVAASAFADHSAAALYTPEKP